MRLQLQLRYCHLFNENRCIKQQLRRKLKLRPYGALGIEVLAWCHCNPNSNGTIQMGVAKLRLLDALIRHILPVCLDAPDADAPDT